MAKQQIGIFPASGGLGSSTYTHLLNKVPHDQVTLISRHPDKIPSAYTEQRREDGKEGGGVTLRQASYESTPQELEAAFAGLDALFLISYPSHVRNYRVKVQLPAVDAARRAGVRHVFYSSLGFALPGGGESAAEVMQAHLATEDHLRRISAADPGFTWTSVREGLYSESFPIYTSFWTLDDPSGEIAIPHDGSGPGVSWVKRDELGEATAALIARHVNSGNAEGAAAAPPEDLKNKIVVLTGPKEWSLSETVRVLASAAGRDVRIREVSVEEWARQRPVRDYFGNEEQALTWATAWEAIRNGETAHVSPTLASVLGRDPEDYETTIRAMAAAVRK
ncbi:hypothetical protein N3K66_003885 [Trichothecium roseum]|uniref:Uncharacterized protein n=1 Tax=Trichothecium roseum TaxID=47278 RepID=A0ACC0V793_9HYPO|nr:hypothetical protein N3K66_003885 [Trichothecium roseum]